MGLYREGGSSARCFVITSLTSGGIFLNIHTHTINKIKSMCDYQSSQHTPQKNHTYTPTPINMYVLYFVFVCFTKMMMNPLMK